MAQITVTNSLKTGLIFDPQAVNIELTGDTFINNGKTILIFYNDGGGPITPTITSVKTMQGLSVQDPSLVIAAAEWGLLGPFPAADFNDANGETAITYAGGIASVTVSAISY